MKLIIISALTAVLAISALYFNSSSRDTESNLDENYNELNITINNVLDDCTRSDSIPIEECKKSALEVLDGCNGLTHPPSACHDPRVFDLSIGIRASQKVESSVVLDSEEKSKSDPEVDEISNKMILLMYWKFIVDTSNELSDLSDDLRIKDFDVVQEKLKYFSVEYDRHKSNLQTLDIIEKYEPVRNKMIQYVELTQNALEHMSAGIQNNDSEEMSEATTSLIKAKDMENEISTIIQVW